MLSKVMDSEPQPYKFFNSNLSLLKKNNSSEISNESIHQRSANESIIKTSNPLGSSNDTNTPNSVPFQSGRKLKRGGRKHHRMKKKLKGFAELINNDYFVKNCKQNSSDEKVCLTMESDSRVKIEVFMLIEFYKSLDMPGNWRYKKDKYSSSSLRNNMPGPSIQDNAGDDSRFKFKRNNDQHREYLQEKNAGPSFNAEYRHNPYSQNNHYNYYFF